MADRLLTVNKVAEILGLKPARVYELSREGKLPFLVRIGERQYRYRELGLQNWLLTGGNADAKREAEIDEK